MTNADDRIQSQRIYFARWESWLSPEEAFRRIDLALVTRCTNRRERARAALKGQLPVERYYMGNGWYISATPYACKPVSVGDRHYNIWIAQ